MDVQDEWVIEVSHSSHSQRVLDFIEMQTRHGYCTERPIWPSEDMLPITVAACPGRDRHLPAWIDLYT